MQSGERGRTVHSIFTVSYICHLYLYTEMPSTLDYKCRVGTYTLLRGSRSLRALVEN